MRKLALLDLFWLVLVAAVALGWWADRNRMARRHTEEEKKAFEDGLKAGNGRSKVDDQLGFDFWDEVIRQPTAIPSDAPKPADSN